MVRSLRRTPKSISALLAIALSACGPNEPSKAPTALASSSQPPTSLASVAPYSSSEPPKELPKNAQVHHVILVTLDGLLPESYLHPDAHGLKIPNLRKLVAGGASSDGALSVFPTVTYPSHTSMVTGVVPAKHGIVSNLAFDPLEQNYDAWRWYAEDIKRETIYGAAEKAGYRTALIHWPVSVGARATYRMPEYWRARTTDDLKLLRSLSTPGFFDKIEKEHPKVFDGLLPDHVQDATLTDIATSLIANEKPNLLLLHLIQVDGEQHHFGVWSKEAVAAIENIDTQVGRLVEAVERAGLTSDTRFIVASDHGFMDAKSMVRPCAYLREGGFVTVKNGRVGDWKATALSSSGQAYVYLKTKGDVQTEDAVRALYEKKVKEPSSGIGRVYTKAEIEKLGGDSEAAIAVEAAPGFQFGSGCLAPVHGEGGYHATHGYDPTRPEMRASLILHGVNVGKGKLVGARLVDIAPTIAEWLGLTLGEVDGTPLRPVQR